MKHIFRSSFWRGGNIFAPEIVTIDEKNITWEKNRGFDWLYLLRDSLSIKRDSIISVTVIDHIIGVSLFIMTNGSSSMIINNLKSEDAQKIKNILV
jgi:hypothetical protein